MSKRLLSISVIAVFAALVAACGGSSKAPGVVTAPSSGATTVAASSVTKSTTSTATSTATTTNVTPPPQLSKEPVVKPPSGPAPKSLVVKDLIKGTGKAASAGSTVTVNYVGILYKGGKQFDASWNRHQPYTTALTSGSVIDGWVKGIPGMKVGGRRELIVPPGLAYKAQGSPPTIPANATLVFVVDLLKVA